MHAGEQSDAADPVIRRLRLARAGQMPKTARTLLGSSKFSRGLPEELWSES